MKPWKELTTKVQITLKSNIIQHWRNRKTEPTFPAKCASGKVVNCKIVCSQFENGFAIMNCDTNKKIVNYTNYWFDLAKNLYLYCYEN